MNTPESGLESIDTAAREERTNVPLAVDLDGTLIRTNLLLESVIALVRQSFCSLFLLPFWLVRGKAALKAEVARRISLDISTLPFNDALIARLAEEKASGRRVYLATGADTTLARKVAEHAGLFDGLLASDGKRNLVGDGKLAALRDSFGESGFDYAGNARSDYPIWRAARSAYVVNASPRVVARAGEISNVEEVVPRDPPTLASYLRMLRLHQWLKNLLLFAPLLAGIHYFSPNAIIALVIGFTAFGLCASSVYILNDIVDIADDRRHPNKRHRPFASGDIPIHHGLLLCPLLLCAAAGLSLLLPWEFAAILALYFLTTLAYSVILKTLEGVDVITLAMLYTARIFAGGAAAGIPLSLWLITFSIFIFLSLAFAKRCAELSLLEEHGRDSPAGRGYVTVDLATLRSMGTAAGYIAALVLALYIRSTQIKVAYDNPDILWFLLPLLVYWITRIWLKTGRGEMPDDPLVFAARDRPSLAIAVLCGAVVALAI